MKKLLSLFGAALLVAGCTEDYKDWANPQTNAPEEAKTVVVAVGSVKETINLAEAGDTVQVFIPNIQSGDAATTTYSVVMVNEDSTATYDIAADAQGKVLASDLQKAVVALYNPNPNIERTVKMYITSYTTVDGMTMKYVSKVDVKVRPEAPVIETAYYYVGAANGWSDSDQSCKFENGGGDLYENPVFTATVPAPYNEDGTRADNWFKIAPESAYTSGAFWDNLIGVETDGDTSVEGKLIMGGNALCQPATDGAKFYRISINMLEQTYTITPISFGDYFYEIGNESGWSTAHALYGGNGDGKYQGYYYLDGEFKFKPNADNWDDDLEYVDGDAMGGSLTSGGGPNCPDPGAGFYRIDLDAASLTYSLKKIEHVSIIGTANGNWDTDTDLTYNKEEGCWEVTTDLNAGEMKFRGNHNWDGDVDLGGSFDNLVKGGSNIAVEAGNYTIKLYISIDGQHKAVVTKN